MGDLFLASVPPPKTASLFRTKRVQALSFLFPQNLALNGVATRKGPRAQHPSGGERDSSSGALANHQNSNFTSVLSRHVASFIETERLHYHGT